MGRKKDREFWDSAIKNNIAFRQYYNRLVELALSAFKWDGLPESVDERFLELSLFSDGQAVFFRDEVMGELALQVIINGPLDVYRVPIKRRAYAVNGYQKELDNTDSVIIYNNLLHTPSLLDIQLYAERMADIDRTIDVNARAQKTPMLITCDETQRLSMLNLYKQYDGNTPVIFGTRGLDTTGISAISTGAEYVADKLYQLKTNIWNEALTYLGISNVAVNKKERLITDEVNKSQGGVIASRYGRLEARRQACEKINDMFGLDVTVDYREDFVPEVGSYE